MYTNLMSIDPGQSHSCCVAISSEPVKSIKAPLYV